MARSRYVIAPKYEFRTSTPSDWVDQVRRLDGVEVIGANARRAQIEATEQSIATVRRLLGDHYHVEAAVGYSKTG